MTGEWQIVFWDVGQGDATDIQLPDKSHILIDAGPSLKQGNPLPAWFLRMDSPLIRLAILTHSHEDHFGGLTELCRESAQRIDRIAVMNDYALRTMPRPGALNALLQSLARRKAETGTKIELREKQGVLYGDSDFQLRLVYPKSLPPAGSLPKDVNQSSMVIVLESLKNSATNPLVVWGGDNTLMNIGTALPGAKPFVLMGPHHGHPQGTKKPKTPDYKDFFSSEVTPQCVYISVGRCNGYRLPDSNYIKGAALAGVRVCCSQLAVNCDEDRTHDVFEGSAMIGVDKPARSVQCRGAMRVYANATSGMRFDKNHAEFVATVRACYPNAACNR